MASYVALTRVKKRGDMLIYRSFDREVFCKCGKDTRMEGPRLLLKHLRGEHIDWKAIEEEFMPRAMCFGCGFVHFKPQYAPGQWARKTKQRYCKECVEANKKRRCAVPVQHVLFVES